MVEIIADEQLERFREDGVPELMIPPEELVVGKRGRAAAFGVNVLVMHWLAGLGAELDPWLKTAIDWLQADSAALGDHDIDGPHGLRRRYRALAIALWLKREDDSAAWQLAAQANAQCPLDDNPIVLADQALPGVPSMLPKTDRSLFAAVRDHRSQDCLDAAVTMGDVGALISRFAPEWIERGAYIQTASWLRFATRTISPDPGLAREILSFLMPSAIASAHSDDGKLAQDAGLVGLTQDRAIAAKLVSLFTLVGLTRDADAVPQPDPPHFTSWTRQPDYSLEVDWFGWDCELPRLEIRGREAGRLAALVAKLLETRLGPSREEALSELLTVPARREPASAAAARARWEILTAAIATQDTMGQLGGMALVRAGLADSDWRVRMAAIWAVGHFRLSGLARETEAAALPKQGFRGLSQEDRRVLLVMRDLAAARSAGTEDRVRKSADAGFVAEVARLLDALPEQPADRKQQLIASLVRPFAGLGSKPPIAWQAWTA